MNRKSRAYPLRRRFNLLLHRWHRRIGVSACLFLIWMAVSGWLLNHTDGLDLAHRHLNGDFITRHYGIHSDMPARAFGAGDHWLAAGADAAVLDGRKIALALSQPRGMVLYDKMLFVAGSAELVLLDTSGALIDRVEAPIVIARIGSGCGGVVIADADKQLVTVDGATFAPCSGAAVWARAQPLTEAQRAQLSPLLQTGVTLERVLLDLHSGRFFGAWGPYFVDAVGLGMTLLALSGLWLFMRHRRSRSAQH